MAAGAPFALQGVPVKLLAADHEVYKLARQSTNDRVLVILQLRGGNDGLNTFIPVGDYEKYQEIRPNVAIPNSGNRSMEILDNSMAAADQLGLHPDIVSSFKDMYEDGKAAIYQGVSYENHSGSHFRGTDIMFMGGDSDEYFDSGWLGRYLGKEFEPLKYPADFPTQEMPDPLALELGREASLIFHQQDDIPTSVSLTGTPTDIYRKISKLNGFSETDEDPKGIPPAFLDGTAYAEEIKYLLGIEEKTKIYIDRLEEVYGKKSDSKVDYPEKYTLTADEDVAENKLSGQLKLIAELLGAGLKTKVFLVKVAGFDTHADQVTAEDSTMGTHAALLHNTMSAMHAFQKDLAERGLEDRVLTVTLSEFGRRIRSNGSLGSDHGSGGPVMLFGKGVNSGVFGTSPNLDNKNVELQFDYRQIYANILLEWMGMDQATLAKDVFYKDFIAGSNPAGGNFEPLDLIKGAEQIDNVLSDGNYLRKHYRIDSVYPNPASTYTQATIYVNNYQNVKVKLVNIQGKVVAQLSRSVAPGTHTFSFVLKGLKPGFYFIKADSERLNDTKKVMIIK